MEDLQHWQYAAIALIFVWSGFVRSGLGFGGAVLALPFLLWIVDDPLLFLPIIAVHLLFFSGLIMLDSAKAARAEGRAPLSSVDWGYLTRAMKIMIIPKMIGVWGLITLPNAVMSGIIFSIVTLYSVSYILNRPIKSQTPWVDTLLLMLGGYVSGTSLIAAPLVVAVFAAKVAADQLRDTLFVLWIVLVSIKMASFLILGIDMQWAHHLWLLPAAFVGHQLGQRFHRALQRQDPIVFYRVLGSALLVVSGAGLWRTAIAT